MKYLTPFAVAIAICWVIQSCNINDVSDTAIKTAISVATSTGLKVAIKDSARRAEIAAYICGPYAEGIRSITGNPTPENFLEQINAFVPQNIKDQYPELLAFVNPIALAAYKQAYEKYQGNVVEIARYLNDVSSGLQSGACK